jgi:hypothetical protein
MLATIPAVLYIDQLGRKPVLIAGALGMGISHLIVAGLYGHYGPTGWSGNSGKVAGWVAVVFVWIYEINFGYSWGVSHNLSKLTLTLLDILLTIFPAWRMGPRR